MKRSSTRILTTHAGSLVRPPEIVEAMIRDHLRERVDEGAFERDLDAAVSSVVCKQAEIGIDVIDDGEFGKSSWIAYLADRLEGMERVKFTPEMTKRMDSPFFPSWTGFAVFIAPTADTSRRCGSRKRRRERATMATK